MDGIKGMRDYVYSQQTRFTRNRLGRANYAHDLELWRPPGLSNDWQKDYAREIALATEYSIQPNWITVTPRLALDAFASVSNPHRKHVLAALLAAMGQRLELHDKLASITPSEEQIESVNCRFQTVEDVATVFNLAGHDVRCKLLK